MFVRNYPAHSLIGLFSVTVIAVETPTRIYVVRNDALQYNRRLLDFVQNYDKSQLHGLLEEEVFINSPVIAAIGDRLFRGSVLDETNNTEKIRVWLGDYAVEATVGLDNLYTMPEVCRRVPWLAVACGIAGVRPVHGQEWPADTCDALSDAILGCRVDLNVLYPDETAEATWVEMLYNNDQDVRVSITDELVKYGHAHTISERMGFNWGNGIGCISDRRRLMKIERKRSTNEIRAFQPPEQRLESPSLEGSGASSIEDRRIRPGVNVTAGDWDVLPFSPPAFSYAEHAASRASWLRCERNFDSSGETDNDSDVE